MNVSTDPRMKKLEDVFNIIQDSVTKEEFVRAFEVLRKSVAAMKDGNEQDLKLMKGAIDALSEKLRMDNSADAKEMRAACDAMLEEAYGALAQVKTQKKATTALMKKMRKFDDGVDGVDAKPEDVVPLVVPLVVPIVTARVLASLPEDVEDTPDELVGKINSADMLITKDSVEGLADLEKAVGEIPKTANGRVGWGAHPLVVKGLGSVIDKNTRVIDFEGSGIASVARSKDGVVTVTVNGGGTGSFSVMVPTGTVNGTNFTFVFSSAPQVIVLDNGTVMNKTNSDTTVNWTGTTTVTLKQAPNFNIFGY